MVELAVERNPLSASAGNGIVLGAFVRSVGSCVEDLGRQADANRTIDTMLGRSYGNRSVHTLTDGESSKRRAAEALAAQNCVREK